MVFGGVHGDYTKQTFIFNQNLLDINKSYCSENMGLLLPFGDKFYFQQMFRITDLPDDIKSLAIKRRIKNDESVSYSENMIVYTGRRGLHIFDID